MRFLWRVFVVLVPVVAYLALGWAVGLGVFVVATIAFLVDLSRASAAVAVSIRCPRGHAVPQYGVHRCGCGAITESWVWRCPVCGSWAGWTACPECGLAVRNPLVR